MSNTGDLGTGILFMCLCLLVPLSIGIILGWTIRGRLIDHGFPWAFLPGFVKRLWEIVTHD